MLRPSGIYRRLASIWSERPAVDWGVSVVAIVIHSAVTHFDTSSSVLRGIDPDRRGDIYMTVASISALIGGFGTAAISQYATANGRRMLELRRRFGVSLRKNWSGILVSMLAVSGGSLLSLMMDDGKKIGAIGWLMEALLILGVLRSMRLVWLFSMLIDMADADVTEPQRSPAIRVPNQAGDLPPV
ncbi:hypothetical protein [Streptomyces griseorubiginosus]|uniref:hypothetical protein n=1 Tax=Streptomyces griseorubiginosus TaxID=67304 RepID=UPI00131CADF1|nr:hypothetical protein [Streptomyces griseorubiginosus]